MTKTKNPGTAAVLGFLFGPLGLLYVSARHALIAFACIVVVSVVTVGVGALPVWIACSVYGYIGANNLNAQNAQRALAPDVRIGQLAPPGAGPSYPPSFAANATPAVSSAKFCASCGARLALTAKFCTKCGTACA